MNSQGISTFVLFSLDCVLLLLQALDFIESTNLKFFTKEMISEFMALKGAFLAQTGRYDSETLLPILQ